MGRPLRFTTSDPAKAIRSQNVAMRTREGDLGPTNSTKYYNAINPTQIGKYVVYQVIDATTAPRSYTPQNDAEFIKLCNQLGAGGISDVTSGLNYIADQPDLLVGSLINTTGSIDVNPVAVYTALGSNPSVQNKWFSTKSPDNFSALNVPTENNSPQPSLSEWICLETTNSVKYGAPYAGTIIYEIDTSGGVTTLVSATSSPSNGSFNVVQDRKYVANKPIHLFRTTRQDLMMPLAVRGQNWGFYFSRNEPITISLYSLNDNFIRFYAGSVGFSNQVGQVSLTAGETNTFVFSDDTYDNTRINLYGDLPFIASVHGNGGDRSGLSLAGEYSYRRDSGGYSSTVAGVNPSGITTNVVYDSSLDSWAFDIADGSGGDSEQSAPLHMLNQNYTLGNQLESYKIVSPYAQTVTISSWNALFSILKY